MIKALLLVSEKKNFKDFLLCPCFKLVTPPPQAGPVLTPKASFEQPQGHHLNNLGRGPLGDATYQISKLCTF